MLSQVSKIFRYTLKNENRMVGFVDMGRRGIGTGLRTSSCVMLNGSPSKMTVLLEGAPKYGERLRLLSRGDSYPS